MRRKAHKKSAARKTRKAPNKWNKFVMSVFGEMKKANKNVSFSDALKEASKRKKKGQY